MCIIRLWPICSSYIWQVEKGSMNILFSPIHVLSACWSLGCFVPWTQHYEGLEDMHKPHERTLANFRCFCTTECLWMNGVLSFNPISSFFVYSCLKLVVETGCEYLQICVFLLDLWTSIKRCSWVTLWEVLDTFFWSLNHNLFYISISVLALENLAFIPFFSLIF